MSDGCDPKHIRSNLWPLIGIHKPSYEQLEKENAALRAKIAKASAEARTASTLIAPSAVAEPSRYLVIKCHIDAALKELE